MIEVDSLTKRYGRATAVDGISFKVEKGEILGFLGPNGAGKTTTMRILTCYLPPTDGTARVAGFDVFAQPLEVKRRVGYTPETPPLYPDMDVGSFLDFCAKIKGVAGKDRKAKIADVMEKTRISDVRATLIGRLSKGYRQRVGLAQAILHNPDVLILDEATSGLDPNQLIEIRQLIRELGKEKTILLSTHIMQEVQALCDRVVIINKGKIVADGNIPMLSQMLTKQHRVKVTFSRAVNSSTLGEIKGYGSHDQKDDHTFIIAGKEDAINEAIFDFAVSKNLKILEMSSMEESVEHIFQQLTQPA